MPYVGNMNTTFTTLTSSDANITDDLTVTDDASFGGTVTVSGDNEKVQLGAGNDLQLYHDGSHSRIKNSTGYLILNSDTGILLKSEDDGTNYMVVTDAGIVTKPLQPACHIELSGVVSNLTVGGASNHTIVFNSELFDQNADFDTSTGIFTCPVAGKYLVNLVLRVENIDTAANTYDFIINTTQRNYGTRMDPDAFDSDTTFFVSSTVLTYASANDTIRIQYYQDSGTSQTDLATAAFLGIHLVA
tara:strand:+ start:2737 stop:3471 length:735 start_codon:yes stop_codon:yes gene_type:complete